MSFQIIKEGLLDTIQDEGRMGYQHLGINPGGVMDPYAYKLGNALLGNELNAPALEMHYPAPVITFLDHAIICVTGADFGASVNQQPVPLYQPFIIKTGSTLQFNKFLYGARCYLAVSGGLESSSWLNSSSTNLIVAAGGHQGRKIKKNDIINCKTDFSDINVIDKDIIKAPWGIYHKQQVPSQMIRFLKGNEWNMLSNNAIQFFLNASFEISKLSNRMGFRLNGPELTTLHNCSMISSSVVFGTIQLLPDGQLIILMADHQTTGGYPRIGHIVSADLHLIAQMNAGAKFKFVEEDHKVAEDELIKRDEYLIHLKNSCTFKMQKFLHELL